jgi:hypothetical protein
LALSKEELSRGNDVAQDNLDRYFDKWGSERHMDPTTTDAAAGETRQSYVDGRRIAYEALRSRT